MENNTTTADQTIPEDILSTFTDWCKQSDRSEADVMQELTVVDSDVMQLTATQRKQLMEVWRTPEVVPGFVPVTDDDFYA